MPTATTSPKKKSQCGAGPSGFQRGNTCASGKKSSNPGKGQKGQRLKSLESNARMAQAHHENLARRGVGGAKLTNALDRAIALKRRAHAERQKKAEALRPGLTKLAARIKAAKASLGPAQAAPAPAPAIPAPATSAKNTAARNRLAARLKAARAKQRDADVGTMKVSDVHFDPERFQYKLAQTDTKTGSVGSLAGVKNWNPDLAGTIQVWKDPASGKTFVVNGHNRLAKAKELGVKDINFRRMKANNATEARAIGAMTNIAEGRGTSIDAAKFFRDLSESTGQTVGKEHLEKHGIPLREKVASEGLALSRLARPIFEKVIGGDLTPARAAIIGESGLDHAQQMGVMESIDKPKKGHELTDRELAIAIADAKAAGTVSKNAGGMASLFGDDDEQKSLVFHRARVIRHIEDKLRSDKKVFGTVAKSRNAEALARANNTIDTDASGKVADEAAYGLGVFNQLRNTGTIARHLGHAAERLARGEKPRDVHSDAYKAVVGSLREAEKF